MAEKKTTVKKTTKVAAADANLSMAALNSQLIDLKKEGMNLRFQHAAGQLPKTHEIRKNRRATARVKTAINAGKK